MDFPESQSNVQGRTGSNTCAFIALLIGRYEQNVCFDLFENEAVDLEAAIFHT